MRRKPARRHPSVALALRRHPRWRSIAAVALGLLSGGVVMTAVQGAEDARAGWGRQVTVLVATRDLAAGEPIDGRSVRRVAHPARLVPEGALSRLPQEGRLNGPVFEGEVLLAVRVAPPRTSAVAARLPPGTRAVAVPVEVGTTPPLSVGDRVEVLVAVAPEVAGEGPPGFALATDVPVVDVSDVAVTIAVDGHVAPRLAAAFGLGAVTLALLP
jgi:Flp pilus assembly protein CpaB